MRIVAIDPGAHVGMAVRRDDGTAHVTMIERQLEQVWDRVIAERPEVIVVERFSTGGHLSKYGHETIEIVGGMRALAYMLGARFVRHTPAQRYPMMQDSRKRLKGKSQHEIDAYAHLLIFEYNHARTTNR